MSQSNDIGEIIVSGVDLRLPQKSPPILFHGGTHVDSEVIEAIRRFMGDGEIIAQAEEIPKCVVYVTGAYGKVDVVGFRSIEKCFNQYGLEACVFEYCPIDKKFIARSRDYFVAARVNW